MNYLRDVVFDFKASILSLVIFAIYVGVTVIFLGKKNRKIYMIFAEIIGWYIFMQFLTAIFYFFFGASRFNMFQETAFIILFLCFNRHRHFDASFVIGCAVWSASTLIIASNKFIEDQVPIVWEQASMILFYAVLFSLTMVFIKKFEVEEYLLTSKLSMIISAAMTLAGLMSTSLWSRDKGNFTYHSEAQNLTFLILLLLVYYLFYYINYEYSNNINLLAMQNRVEIDRNNYEVTQQHYEEMRILRHEIKNHDAYIKLLVDNGEYDKLENFLSESEKKNESVLRKNDFGNQLVSAIINSQILKAEEAGIELNFTASIPQTIGVPDMDLFSLLSNILDNAREAESKQPDSIKRYIEGSIIKKDNYLFIHTENHADTTMDKRDILKLRTEKPNAKAHGYGTKIIRMIAERHNGTVHFDVKNGFFSTDVMLEVKE